jgi:hypothetical protein
MGAVNSKEPSPLQTSNVSWPNCISISLPQPEHELTNVQTTNATIFVSLPAVMLLDADPISIQFATASKNFLLCNCVFNIQQYNSIRNNIDNMNEIQIQAHCNYFCK